MAEQKDLRIGLLGFGSMGRTHTWAVRNLPFFFGALPFRAVTAGVCTTTEEKSRRVAEEFGIPIATANEDDLIGNPDIDIIDICTPNNCHYRTVKKALAAGKHVLCEAALPDRRGGGRACRTGTRKRQNLRNGVQQPLVSSRDARETVD